MCTVRAYKHARTCMRIRGAHSKNFWGGCQIFWDRLSWLSFLIIIIIIIIKSLFKLSIIVSADNTMTAGINTSAEILFSSYPPARSIIFSKNCYSLLFKDYNLKMINKRIRAGIAPICTCNQKKTHQEDSEYSIFVSIFIF